MFTRPAALFMGFARAHFHELNSLHYRGNIAEKPPLNERRVNTALDGTIITNYYYTILE